MNVDDIRTELTTLVPAGYTSYAFVPDVAAKLPAVIVGVPREIDYGESLGLALVTLPLTIAVSITTMEDAQRRLNLAVSTGNDESIRDAFEGALSDAWSKCHVASMEAVRKAANGADSALALDLILEVHARK